MGEVNAVQKITLHSGHLTCHTLLLHGKKCIVGEMAYPQPGIKELANLKSGRLLLASVSAIQAFFLFQDYR